MVETITPEDDAEHTNNIPYPKWWLLPHPPQGPTYGPVGIATPGDKEYHEYEATHRPLVPSIEHKMDQLVEDMIEQGKRYREAEKPENIIAKLNEEINELEETIWEYDAEILLLQEKILRTELSIKEANLVGDSFNEKQEVVSYEKKLLITNTKIEVFQWKIAKCELKILKRQKSINIVNETGKLPVKPFKYKSNLHKFTNMTQKEVTKLLKK